MHTPRRRANRPGKFAAILELIDPRLRFLALVLLLAASTLGLIASSSKGIDRTLLVAGTLLLAFIAVSVGAWLTIRHAGLSDTVPRRLQLILALPRNLPLDLPSIEWDNNDCYVLHNRKSMPVHVVPSGLGPSFSVHLSERLVAAATSDAYCELQLKDRRGLSWKVTPFYIFQTHKELLPTDRRAAIEAYGDDIESASNPR
jgi:hypothetical protein